VPDVAPVLVNSVWGRLHLLRPAPGADVPHHLRTRVRYWRTARLLARLYARIVLRERYEPLRMLQMVAKGAADGRGRASDGPRSPTAPTGPS
jgi:hypothetical protein